MTPSRKQTTTPQPPLADIRDAALRLHADGLNVLAVRRDKKSIGKWKRWQTERQAERDVRDMMEYPQAAGVAIVCGCDWNGVAVRDYDDQAVYDDWRHKNKALAKLLPTVETSRGRHVYFKCVGLQSTDVEAGELRGRGNYVVAPPTIHASGVQYRWIVPFVTKNLREVDPAVFGAVAGQHAGSDCPHDVRTLSPKCRQGVAECHREQEDTEETERRTPFVSLPLCLSVTLAEAVRRTVPQTTGQRNRLLFEFARRLKWMPECAGATTDTLRPIVMEWHRQALPVIGTKPFIETWSDFLMGYTRATTPYGQGTIDRALARAAEAPISDTVAERFDSEPARLLYKLCRELQRDAGVGNPFYLGCPTAEKLIVGLDRRQASRFLNCMVLEGILTITKKGAPGGNTATRYTFNEPLNPDQEQK